MTAIEPGQSFTIQYGNDHTIDVVALAGRKQRLLANKIKELVSAEREGRSLDLFDLSEEALAMCLGDERAAELFESAVDAEMAIDIATKTLGKQSLSDDDKKKLESSP